MQFSQRILIYLFYSFIIHLFFVQCSPTNNNLFYAKGKKFAIATDHPLASEVGMAIYKQGGNVVDALIASSFAISVLRPQSTGIGGGGFALVKLQSNLETKAYDFRERAPMLSSSNMFLDSKGRTIPGKSLFGTSSVAVPGMVKGLWEIHQENGKLRWEELIEPSIQIAENGFKAYPNLIESIQSSQEEMDFEMKKIFLPNGQVPQIGDLVIQKDLANTLKNIQVNGYVDFYHGDIADKIHQRMLQDKAFLRKKDLENYQVKRKKTIQMKTQSYILESMPLPSSAVFLFQIFKILEYFDLKQIKSKENGEYTLLLVEAMKEAFLDRANYGQDPEFNSIVEENLLNEEYIQKKVETIQKKLKDFNNPPTLINEDNKPTIPKTMESYNTTHISVIDSDGNIALSTHSINYIFGSRTIPKGTGIILNDTMDDFSSKDGNAYGLVGGENNKIQPGKTPLSSMSPTIVYKNNNPWIGIGAPGGSFIFTSIFHTLLNRMVFDHEPYESVSLPRIHYQANPNIVFVEEGWSHKERNSLKDLYHWKEMQSKAKVFYVELTPNGVIAVSDPRGQGRALAK